MHHTPFHHPEEGQRRGGASRRGTESPTRAGRRSLGIRLAVLAVPLAVVVAGCGDDTGSAGSSSGNDQATTTTKPSTTASSSGADQSGSADVTVADTDLGKVVADGQGRVLYAFTPDSSTSSACTGACATAWPPAEVSGTPTAKGLDTGDLTVIKRDDGSEQVAFHGHPLYTYAGDAKAGDTTGQGSGGKWYVVGTDGNLVKDAPSSSGSGSGSGSGY
jgi:predicted lipoprotein with Yx(FWY)xxD motif